MNDKQLFLVVGALALLAAGCSPPLVQVRVDEPIGVPVVIEEGFQTPAVKTRIPFKGSFEAVSIRESNGYRLTMELDEATAARYGGSGPVKLYGRLCLQPPKEADSADAVVLRVDPNELRALIEGKRGRIETKVEGSTAYTRANLILRMRPED
jgi:hypothetical protein